MNYVVIEGNIGAGKTTLAKFLSDRLKARLLLENFSENPFLPKFYENPDRYAFSLEIFFLTERYHQLQKQLLSPDLFNEWTISDFAFEKSAIFAAVTLNNYENDLFLRIFSTMKPQIPSPTHTIWLQCSIERLLKSIKERGRPYEKSISADYLEKIQEQYNFWLRIPKNLKSFIIIDREKYDFLMFPEHLEVLVSWVKEGKSGHFST